MTNVTAHNIYNAKGNECKWYYAHINYKNKMRTVFLEISHPFVIANWREIFASHNYERRNHDHHDVIDNHILANNPWKI